jgi:hypothetical protein
MSNPSTIIKGRHGMPNSGTGCAPIVLGTVSDTPTRAIHCNAGGTAILTFADGSKAPFTLAEGGLYDFAITKAATAGGTDPELVAIY